jgi:hypothetical protein
MTNRPRVGVAARQPPHCRANPAEAAHGLGRLRGVQLADVRQQSDIGVQLVSCVSPPTAWELACPQNGPFAGVAPSAPINQCCRASATWAG